MAHVTGLREQPSFFSRPRILYTSVFCWISVCGGRFLAIFLERVASMSASEIGLTLAIQQLVGALLSGAAASIADVRERRFPNRGRAQVVAAGITIGSACFLLHTLASSTIAHVALQVLYAASACLVWPVLDGMTIQYLRGREEEYGKERLFGAVSWAVTNLVLSFALDKVGFTIMYPLTLLSATGVMVSLWIYVKLQRPKQELSLSTRSVHRGRDLDEGTTGESPPDSATEIGSPMPTHRVPRLFNDSDASEGENDPPSLHDGAKGWVNENFPVHDSHLDVTVWAMLLRMARSELTLAFAICVLCLAVGQILVDSLVFLLFEYLGGSYSVMGLTVVLTVLFEIPIFSLAPWMLDRIGPPALLMVAGGCYVVRSVAYSVVPRGHVLYALLVEPLHGVTYACGQTASVDFIARGHPLLVLPPGFEASSQGLLQAIKGAGSVLGLVAGGLAEDTVGPRVMYRFSAGAVALGCSVFAVAFYRHRLRGNVAPVETDRVHHHERVPTSCREDDSGDLELAGMDMNE
jgi:Na+/melibiose symporter-like transporter